jgi:hypothetical protein
VVNFCGRFADLLLVPCVAMLLQAMGYAAERAVVLLPRAQQAVPLARQDPVPIRRRTGWLISLAAKA